MDPKDNSTQTPPIDDQDQPTPQQKTDGELVVSHEVELVTTAPSSDQPTDGVAQPSADLTAIAGDTTDPNGSDAMGADVGNGVPADSFTAPETPATPATDQPVTPVDTSAMPGQPTDQPFPPAAAPTAVDPSVAPVMPTDTNAPAPAMPPTDLNAAMPAGNGVTEGKNRAMVLLLVLIGAVVVLGLGIYAVMQL